MGLWPGVSEVMSLRRSARTATTLTTPSEPDANSRPDRKRSLAADNVPIVVAKKSGRRPIQKPTKNTAKPTSFEVPPLPFTPKRKRTSAKQDHAEPLTPTPSLVGLITTPTYSSGDIDDATPPPLLRPADPHTTNATLVTPGGTQATAYPSNLSESSPFQAGPNGRAHPSSTTSTLLSQACSHLVSIEPKLAPLIRKHRCNIFSPSGLAEKIDPFRSLVSGIMAQQVSGAAAKSIKNKFIALFNEDDRLLSQFPSPAQVAATETSRLRLAGLSQRKAEYIHGLAEKFASGELSTSMLLRASDEEVMEKLIAVRGLGKWSVEMFACFGLKRMDVFSTGDLGVQRGMAAFMGKDVSKLKAKGGGKWKYMSEKDMLDGSEKFRPYRSLFMWYMWRAEGVDVSAVEAGNVDGDADVKANSVDQEDTTSL
jgi:DNA-3-methyladenine glycosylase II